MTFKEMYRRFENEVDVCKFQRDCGLRFLLVRSLDKPNLKELIEKHQGKPVCTKGVKVEELMERAFELDCSDEDFINFIKSKKQALLVARKKEIEGLDGVLDVLPIVNCGVRNDKVDDIVQKFVRNKSLKTIDALYENLDDVILPCIRQYCLWSYFNQTSNDIIETLFLEHDLVVPTLRKIHDIDFFVNVEGKYIPFDLKITHVSDDYFELLSQGLNIGSGEDDFIANSNGISELDKIKDFYKQLKQKSKDLNLPNLSGLSKSDIIAQIEKCQSKSCDDFISKAKRDRSSLVSNTTKNLKTLEWWNYKYQGERLFCNNNRIYLFLSNKRDFGDARELKADVKNIKKVVNALMSSIKKSSIHNINYVYEKDDRHKGAYTAKSLSTIYCK